MTDNIMEYMTVSMCGADALDWCGGYNEAVTKANEIINLQNAEIERLEIEVVIYSKKNYIKAIKDFAERLCEDRVPNDPVVIAVKTEMKFMIGEQE